MLIKYMIFSIVLIVLILNSYFITCSNLFRNLESYSLIFDNTNWNYDSTNEVYYQIGVVYCTKPVNTEYQSLGIYVLVNI